jgi:hypothetical protein
MEIHQHGCFEATFEDREQAENPIQIAPLEVEYLSPSGKSHRQQGYWDGGNSWRVRFSPDEVGTWHCRCRCERFTSFTLNASGSQFNCVPYSGENPLYRHGPLKVSANRRFLTHADDTPFFWLGDTAWNGALLSSEEEWESYLDDRQSKGFSVVQFVVTHWMAAAGNTEGRQAFYGREIIFIDPVFHQRLDARIQAVNRRGMVAALVLAWAATWNPWGLDLNPGTSLPEDQILQLIQYQSARWGAFQVVWILAGDADYRGSAAEQWKRIARATWGTHTSRLATMHPGGGIWVGEEFRAESWFSFVGYQSGHSSSPQDLFWMLEGPPSKEWGTPPAMPVINLEPNYEAHHDFHTGKLFDDRAVRRAAYWSLLVAPPAGVTYGAHGIWSWERAPVIPMNHLNTACARPWFEAIHLPGSMDMRHLATLLAELSWWELEPGRALLSSEVLQRPLAEFVALAVARARDWALAYLPVGGSVTLRLDQLNKPGQFRWYDPRSGNWSSSVGIEGDRFSAPDRQDWVLWIGP